jgi:glycosyltransferase involved in cell wall biosynthesis
MRILLVTPMPPRAEAPGATPLVLNAQVAGLRERHELTIVTTAHEPGELEAARELQDSGLEVHTVDAHPPQGIDRWRRRRRLASTWSRGKYPWRTVWFADPQVQETIDRLTCARHFDIAAVEDNSMGVFRFPRSLPTVLTEHEVRRPRAFDRACGPPPAWPRWAFRELDWRRWPSYERWVWGRFDRVQVFTERDSRSLLEIAPEMRGRVRVTPFGVELPERLDPAREEPDTVLFVGNFTHPPNVDAACWLAREILPRIRSRSDAAHLMLVGGAVPEQVRGLAAADVTVVGEVPTIAARLEAAAVVVAPVRTGGGMRMKVLHALAAGKAVVTTTRGREGLALDGVQPPLLVADDSDGFAAATAALLDDLRARRALGERARAFAAEHYSAEAYGRRLEAVYEEIVSARRPSPARQIEDVRV